ETRYTKSRSASARWRQARTRRRKVPEVDRCSNLLGRLEQVRPERGGLGILIADIEPPLLPGGDADCGPSVVRRGGIEFRHRRKAVEVLKIAGGKWLETDLPRTQLAQPCAQAIGVLAPVEIRIHQDALRMAAGQLVEIRQVIGVGCQRGAGKPEQAE